MGLEAKVGIAWITSASITCTRTPSLPLLLSEVSDIITFDIKKKLIKRQEKAKGSRVEEMLMALAHWTIAIYAYQRPKKNGEREKWTFWDK